MTTKTTLSAHLPSLADLGRKTSLDGCDGPTGSARVAGDERQTVLSLAQLRVGRLAGLARDVFDDVLAQHYLQLLGLEATLDDQLPATSDRAAGTQLGEQERGDVLVGALHALADLSEVGEDGLLVAFAHTLGRRDLVALAASRGVLGVLLGEGCEESTLQRRSANRGTYCSRSCTHQEEVVFYGGDVVVAPDTSSSLPVIVVSISVQMPVGART